MRQVFEVLRLAYDQGLSRRELARALGLSQRTVHAYLRRFRASGLAWPVPPELDEAAIETRLFTDHRPPTGVRPAPEWAAIHAERKRKGVTLQLLWIEYKQREPTGFQYTQFCQRYHDWATTIEPVLRQVHVAGDKVFVDYAGLTMPVVETTTGDTRAAQIFVSALGASHLIYADATWTQSLPDWIGSHVRMLEYVGGVPALIVPDNLKAGVTSPCYFEPVVHPTYQDFATHYGTAILPARVRRPRDKAKVETAVQIVEREILAPLRHDVFHSLAELQHAIRHACDQLNARPFQTLAGSRRSVFEATERAALRALPPTRYELAEWKSAKVNIDYHISVDGHLYSVPYRLVGAQVAVRLAATILGVLRRGARVAAHARSAHKGQSSTEPTHRPKAHRRHLEWTPSRLVAWGVGIGPATGAVIGALLARCPHPEQSCRVCLGLLSLKKRYDAARLEAACVRAQAAHTCSYRSVKSILVTALDTLPLDPVTPTIRLPATHAHVRGAAYYHHDTSVVDAPLTLAVTEAPC